MTSKHFLDYHDPERQDFQLDRFILFSDAIFAIAITLLVIEIKAPEMHAGGTNLETLQQLAPLLPKAIGFVISFWVIANYWRIHHRIFGFVKKYTNRLIFLNFLFLFTLIIMPFSSSYYSENSFYAVPYYFYNANIILTGVANFILISYVFNPQHGVVRHTHTAHLKAILRARSLVIPAIFLIGILLRPFSLELAQWSPILSWPAFYLVKVYYGRKVSA